MKLQILPLLVLVISCQQVSSQVNVPLDQLPQVAGPFLRSDLNQYKSEMEENHPGLFWYQDKNEWDSLFEVTATQLTDGADIITFYRQLSQINARVGCGHTSVRLGRDYRDIWMDTARIFPVKVKIIDQELVVDEVLTDSEIPPKGSQITSINGHPVDQIIQQMATGISMDGFNETGKYRRIERGFGLRLLHFVDPFAQSYAITYHSYPAGEARQVTLEGVDYATFEEGNQENEDLLTFRPIHGLPGTYYMRIKTFSSSWMRSRGFSYNAFLEQSFRELKDAGAQSLILDLRGNGGGDDGNGSRLMSYLVAQSFGYYRSIEVTSAYDGWGSPDEEEGKFYITAHNDLGSHQPRENRFEGKLYILIDGGSFSATSEFAALMHHRDRARFIGEETGGGYYGNTSGNRKRVVLSNSGLDVSIPYWRYLVDVDGNAYYGQGVPPDDLVTPTVADLISGTDTVLEFTVAYIGRQ